MAERYKAAKDAGFQFVEVSFPYRESIESLSNARRESGLEQVLINSYPGWSPSTSVLILVTDFSSMTVPFTYFYE